MRGDPIGNVLERTSLSSFRRDEERALTRDTIFSVLSNERRRLVIHYLKQAESTVTLRDLARQIACWENDVTQAELTYKQRKRVYTSLHQSHLPKLQATGIVDYDRDRGTVSLSSQADQLDLYLEIVPQDDIPWSKFYLGLAGVSAFNVVCASADLFPFSLLSGLGHAALITCALGVAAVAHISHNRRMRLGDDELPTDRTYSVDEDE